jgi:hypothetical protein
MNIVLLALLDGTKLITKLEELSTQLGEPDCLLIDPYLVLVTDYYSKLTTNVLTESGSSMAVQPDTFMEPWLTNYTSNNKFKIHSDKILTIVEPKNNIKSKYLNLIGYVDVEKLPEEEIVE